jgi:hypothetical protein
MFVVYMYSCQITLPRAPTKAKPPPQYLFGAYYLADVLGAPRFKNALIDQLSRELRKADVPSVKFVKWQKALFSKIKAEGIRKLISNTFYLKHRKNYGLFGGSSYHHELQHEQLKLAFGHAKDRPKANQLKDTNPNYCQHYHQHDAFNPEWTCVKEKQSRDPFKNKATSAASNKKGGSTGVMFAGYRQNAQQEWESDELYNRGLQKPKTKKRKVGADPEYVDSEEGDDDDDFLSVRRNY